MIGPGSDKNKLSLSLKIMGNFNNSSYNLYHLYAKNISVMIDSIVNNSLKVITKLAEATDQTDHHHVDVGKVYHSHEQKVPNSTDDQTDGQDVGYLTLPKSQIFL